MPDTSPEAVAKRAEIRAMAMSEITVFTVNRPGWAAAPWDGPGAHFPARAASDSRSRKYGSVRDYGGEALDTDARNQQPTT